MVTLARLVGRRSGVRVDDVRAALGGAGGGDGEVAAGDDGEDGAGAARVADADPPGLARRRFTRELDVAAAVDRVVTRAVGGEQIAGPLDRPSLDHARRVERAVRSGVDREKTFGSQRETCSHSAKTSRTCAEHSASETSPRASRLTTLSVAVGAERRVDLVQPADRLSDRRRQSPGSRMSNENTVPMQCSTWTVRGAASRLAAMT